MKKNLKEKETLDDVVNVRITKAEKERLREDAEISGLTISEVMRRRYFRKPILSKTDAAVLRELRRLGGLLKYVDANNAGYYSLEVKRTLKTLNTYLKSLIHDSEKGWESEQGNEQDEED